MSGSLFVVATPIGNLEDITLRALRVLREVDLIAAEDTRRTARLLAHHGISTPTISFHAHNTASRLPHLVGRLEAGERVAVVTDAGTPGVSDPGAELVHACRARGIPVDPVPGVSAPLAAAVASGFPLTPLTIWGFAPARPKERRAWLTVVGTVAHTFTFFEAPHRIRQTLEDAAEEWGERPMAVGRELTKRHQEVIFGTARSVAAELVTAKGEFTVVVGPAIPVAPPRMAASDADILHEFCLITKSGGGSRRQAIVAVARKFGWTNRQVYAAVESAKAFGHTA